jgi:hypothetical protein
MANRLARSVEPVQITIPFNFNPRAYQLPFLIAMGNGIKRAVIVWPRRHGKDKTCLNLMIKRMFPESTGGRIGTYFHIFPTYAQAKKVIWDAIDGNQFKVMNHFPPAIVAGMNETELQVTLTNGSIYQLIGSDKPESILGTNPVGIIYSEYSVQDPKVADLLSPILVENGGWAVYNFTPKGHNHAWKLFNMAKNNPDWFCERLTVDDTLREDGTPVISHEAVEKERAQGKTEEFIQQEYYTSFEGFQEGTIYGTAMLQAEKDKRITDVPYNPQWPVFTFWDLGYGDATAIWFAQRLGDRINLIDYYEQSGAGIPHYAKILRNEKPYNYVSHYWPHDGRAGDFSTGEVRRDVGESNGIRPIEIVKRGSIEDGIEAVRKILPRCYFDREKCASGIAALQAYAYKKDEERNEFSAKPLHNWASNGSDALRTMAMSDSDTVAQEYYEGYTGENIKVLSNARDWYGSDRTN